MINRYLSFRPGTSEKLTGQEQTCLRRKQILTKFLIFYRTISELVAQTDVNNKSRACTFSLIDSNTLE